MRTETAALVPDGTEIGAMVRVREHGPSLTDKIDLTIVKIGESGLTKHMQAVRWCHDLQTGEKIGFVYEGEPVVVEV